MSCKKVELATFSLIFESPRSKYFKHKIVVFQYIILSVHIAYSSKIIATERRTQQVDQIQQPLNWPNIWNKTDKKIYPNMRRVKNQISKLTAALITYILRKIFKEQTNSANNNINRASIQSIQLSGCVRNNVYMKSKPNPALISPCPI